MFNKKNQELLASSFPAVEFVGIADVGLDHSEPEPLFLRSTVVSNIHLGPF
jgi:hypothetical protein